MMRYAAFIAFAAACAAPAFAQGIDPPRFEGFEQQQRDLDRQRVEDLDRQRQDALIAPLSPNNTVGDQALRLQNIQREQDRLQLEFEQRRLDRQRERDIAAATLPNRTILPSASEVIVHPESFALPPAPRGQYYARVDGRFALVDAGTNKPIKFFERSPDETGSTVPAIGLPRPVEPPTRYQKLPQQPPLPAQLIGPTSPLVVRDFSARKLGPAPKDTYYAEIEGSIYLVDARTQKVIALIRK